MNLRAALRRSKTLSLWLALVVAAPLVIATRAEPARATAGAEVLGNCKITDEGEIFWQAAGDVVAPDHHQRGWLKTQVYYLVRADRERKVVIARKRDTTPNDHGDWTVTGRAKPVNGVSTYRMRAIMQGRYAMQRIWVDCRRGATDRDHEGLDTEASCGIGDENVRFGGIAASNESDGRLRVQLYYVIQTETQRKVVIKRAKDFSAATVPGAYTWGVSSHARRVSGVRRYWTRSAFRDRTGYAIDLTFCNA